MELFFKLLSYSRARDQNPNDNRWRLRALLKLFRSNILKITLPEKIDRTRFKTIDMER